MLGEIKMNTYCVMKDVRRVRTVPGVDYAVNVSTAVSVTALMARVLVRPVGKVHLVIDLVMLDTTDRTVSTGSYCTQVHVSFCNVSVVCARLGSVGATASDV